MSKGTARADALHRCGSLGEAGELFKEAENLQAEDELQYPRLYSLPGFRNCDLLLDPAERGRLGGGSWTPRMGVPGGNEPSTARRSREQPSRDQALPACDQVGERAEEWRSWRTPNDFLLDISLEQLTLARAALYRGRLASLRSPDRESRTEAAAKIMVKTERKSRRVEREAVPPSGYRRYSPAISRPGKAAMSCSGSTDRRSSSA